VVVLTFVGWKVERFKRDRHTCRIFPIMRNQQPVGRTPEHRGEVDKDDAPPWQCQDTSSFPLNPSLAGVSGELHVSTYGIVTQLSTPALKQSLSMSSYTLSFVPERP